MKWTLPNSCKQQWNERMGMAGEQDGSESRLRAIALLPAVPFYLGCTVKRNVFSESIMLQTMSLFVML